MSPAEYRAALTDVGLSLSNASTFFQTDERTTRRWASDDSGKAVPRAVAITLRLMAKYGLKPQEVTTLMNEDEDAAQATAAAAGASVAPAGRNTATDSE